MTTSQKRPLGLKGRKQLQQQLDNEERENKKQKTQLTGEEEENGFSTVALPSTKATDQTSDGLTLSDLIQLKNQADQLIDNPSGLDEDDDQLVNLLRGICHEAIRQIEITETQENRSASSSLVLTHQLLGWATLELGIFLTLHQQPTRFIQEDEPESLQAWLLLSFKILDNLPTEKTPEKLSESLPADFDLLPSSIALFKAQTPSEIATILDQFGCRNWSREQSIYLLRTIDRISLLKSDVISQGPTPIFNILIKLLETILTSQDDLEGPDAKAFKRLIDQRLADSHLTHGSLLAERLEEKYFPDQQLVEDPSNDDDQFVIDIQDPSYILAHQNLRAADKILSKLIEEMDESSESKDELKTKLDETLLTIGNLLPPGPEREELYLRAGLGCDNDENDEESSEK